MTDARNRMDPTDIIQIVGTYSPREGTRDGATWNLLRDGMSVSQIQDKYSKTKFAKKHPSQANFLSALRRRNIIKVRKAPRSKVK